MRTGTPMIRLRIGHVTLLSSESSDSSETAIESLPRRSTISTAAASESPGSSVRSTAIAEQFRAIKRRAGGTRRLGGKKRCAEFGGRGRGQVYPSRPRPIKLEASLRHAPRRSCRRPGPLTRGDSGDDDSVAC